MSKALSEMTTKELWKLFPVELIPCDLACTQKYEDEVELLKQALDKITIKRISHIGSTCIPDLVAKPIVDILLEVSGKSKLEQVHKLILHAGYSEMGRQVSPYFSRSYCKGCSEDGNETKIFHLVFRKYADWPELYFRDYLIEHHDVAMVYGDLKVVLAKEYEHNYDGYLAAKSEFIEGYTRDARRMYRGRYEPKRRN